MFRLVYTHRLGNYKEHTLAFLTLHYFNNNIVEGHKILSDRIINTISKVLDWNILIISLERVGFTSLKNEVPYWELPPPYIDWFTNTVRTFDILKSMNTSIIHILAYNKVFPALLNGVTRTRRKRIVAHLYYHPTAFRDFKYFPQRLLLKLDLFDEVITTSKTLKEYLTKNLDLPDERVQFIPPIIPEDFFFEFDYIASRDLTSQIRRKYGLNESDFIITYVGHIIPQRGVFELVMAFKEAIKCNSSLKLLISHSNIVFKDFSVNYPYLLKKIIEKYNLQNKVVLLGKQDLKTLYTLSDILFFGFKESFYFTYPPLVVCEAMVAGVPFILRSSTLVNELFTSTPPVPVYNNIDQLIDILCSMPDRNLELYSTSRTLKEIALSNYHPSVVTSKLLRTYYMMLKK